MNPNECIRNPWAQAQGKLVLLLQHLGQPCLSAGRACTYFAFRLQVVVLCLASTAIEAVAQKPVASQQRRSEAIQALQSKNVEQLRKLLTATGSASHQASVSAPSTNVAKVSRSSKPTFLVSLKELSSQGKVNAGDVVVLSGASSGSLNAIYMGEESFPGATKQEASSFFLYELSGRFLYSTLPPRADKQSITSFLKSNGKTLTPDKLFSPYKWEPDSERGNVEWLAASKSGKWLSRGGYRNISWMTNAKIEFYSSSLSSHAFTHRIEVIDKLGAESIGGPVQIIIEFDPAKSKRVKDAKQVGFVQVVSCYINAKPVNHSRELIELSELLSEMLQAEMLQAEMLQDKELSKKQKKDILKQKDILTFNLNRGKSIASYEIKLGEEYFHVDANDPKTGSSPSYNASAGAGWDWAQSGSKTRARLTDAPQTDFYFHDKKTTDVTVIFEAWSFCVEGKDALSDSTRWYEGLKWKFVNTRHGLPKIEVLSETLSKPSEGFLKAVEHFTDTFLYNLEQN